MLNRTAQKRCSRCKKNKPLEYFSKSKANEDGLCCRCKECDATYSNSIKLRAFRTISPNIRCCKHDVWHCCEIPDNIDYLSLDHINNDGGEHRKKIGSSGNPTYRWVIKNKKEARKRMQIMCHNAQKIKDKLHREPKRYNPYQKNQN